jgi:hypothetical protein
MPSFRIVLAAAFVFAVAPALAQNAPVASARATIQTISADGSALNVHTRAGEDQTIHLSPKTRFVLVVPAALTDVKPGSFIGVAALPGEGNELKAMEVHIFPEAMRGTGEGFRPFDLAPSDLKSGAAIIARGPKQDDGSIDAAFVLVGKDGLVPPM